jgi:hypothetical protein
MLDKILKFTTLSSVLLLTMSAPASASTAWQGTLAAPHFMNDGVVLVYTSGSRTDIPSCGAGQPGRFAFDSTTAAGKSQLAGILAAFSMGRQVIIVGTGNCSVYGDSEAISYFYIYD